MKLFFLVLFWTVLGNSAINPVSKSNSHVNGLKQMAMRDWPNAVRIEVSHFNLQSPAPEGAVITQLSPRPVLGAVSFEMEWSEKGLSKQTRGSAIVKVYQSVAIAQKNLNHGDFFSSDTITFKEMEISRYHRTGVFTSWDDLKDKLVKGFVRSGTVISAAQAQKPIEIQSGQMVDLLFENNQMLITARMKALESGRAGDWIRVENPASKRVVRARVAAAGQVVLR